MKEYWGEGSAAPATGSATTWAAPQKLSFEEGVDSYVPYAGSAQGRRGQTCYKVKSTMCNCGALTIPELRRRPA